jgi:hypothetical protein
MDDEQGGGGGILRLAREAVAGLAGRHSADARFLTEEEIDAVAASPIRPARAIRVEPLDRARLERAKAAFTTRRVSRAVMATLISGGARPRMGDLVLARVDRLRHHQRIELPTGRKSQMHVGDEIIVVYANRYAPDQFEAYVPSTLGPPTWSRAAGSRRTPSRAATRSPAPPRSRPSAWSATPAASR